MFLLCKGLPCKKKNHNNAIQGQHKTVEQQLILCILHKNQLTQNCRIVSVKSSMSHSKSAKNDVASSCCSIGRRKKIWWRFLQDTLSMKNMGLIPPPKSQKQREKMKYWKQKWNNLTCTSRALSTKTTVVVVYNSHLPWKIFQSSCHPHSLFFSFWSRATQRGRGPPVALSSSVPVGTYTAHSVKPPNQQGDFSSKYSNEQWIYSLFNFKSNP